MYCVYLRCVHDWKYIQASKVLVCIYVCTCIGMFVIVVRIVYIYIYMVMLMFLYDVMFEMISLFEIVLYITCSVCTVNLLRGSVELYWTGTR